MQLRHQRGGAAFRRWTAPYRTALRGESPAWLRLIVSTIAAATSIHLGLRWPLSIGRGDLHKCRLQRAERTEC